MLPGTNESNGLLSGQPSSPSFGPLLTREIKVTPSATKGMETFPSATGEIKAPSPMRATEAPIRQMKSFRDALRNPERYWPNPKAAADVEAQTTCIPECVSSPAGWAPETSSAIIPPASRHHRSHILEPVLLCEPEHTVLWAKDMPETIPESLRIYLEAKTEEFRTAEEERRQQAKYMAMIRARVAPNKREITRYYERSIFGKAPAPKDEGRIAYLTSKEYHLGTSARATATRQRVKQPQANGGPAVPTAPRLNTGAINRSRPMSDAAPGAVMTTRPRSLKPAQTAVAPPARSASAIAAAEATRAAVAAVAAAAKLNS